MAHGKIALATGSGATAGLAAGPLGAALGAAGGYVVSSGLLDNIFGNKKKPVPVPWYKQPKYWYIIGGSAVGLVVIVLLVRR